MKNTTHTPIPVRFRMLAGGTAPGAVVDLMDALQPIVAAHLTSAEAGRTTGGAGHIPDNADYVAQSSGDDPASPQSDPPGGEAAERPENEPHATSDSAGPPPLPSPAAMVREILVPIDPKADPQVAKQSLISRLTGPLPARTSIIMQTSGSTTARGHLVALSASALVASARSTSAQLGRPGRWILALPTQHIAGLQVLVRSIMAGTRPVVLDTTKGFNPSALVRAVDRATADPEIPAYISLVPTQLAAVLDEGGPGLEALTRCTKVLLGGAPTTPYLLDRARAASVPITITYGMTETCGGCVYDGLPLAGVQVAVVGGQVLVSGTVLMEGYLEAPELGAEPHFVEMGTRRWLRTNDTGRMEGPRLTVQGRSDDVIITGGVKVHASAVEHAAQAVRGVGEVVAVGLPDARWGEVVTAVVVPATDVDVDLLAPLMGGAQNVLDLDNMGGIAEPDSLAARIRTAVTAELGGAHAPRIIVVVPFLPRAGLGKVDRREAAAMAGRELRAGRAWVR